MTVCIAARSRGMLILASDRMISTADVQYEPEVPKIIKLTSSIALMYSGDAGVFAEVGQSLSIEIEKRIATSPTEWFAVDEAARLWGKHFIAARMRHAEATVLTPFGLDRKSFVGKISSLGDLAHRLTDQMLNYRIPGVEVIIAGVDQRHGEDSPSIWQGVDEEVWCADQTGFAVIGSGARHAESQFMLAGYSGQVPNGDALMLVYSAKRKAEVAPGVGRHTDMMAIGTHVGQSFWLEDDLKEKLQHEYQNVIEAELKALADGRKAISDHLNVIASQNEAAVQSANTSSSISSTSTQRP